MFAEPKENQKALMQALCLRYPQLTYCHNHVIGISTLTSGSAAGTIADPKHVFSIALVANAVNIIIAHNHPSGSITPSFADFELTARIMVAGELLGLKVLDHMIITTEGFYSFASEGTL